MHLRSVWSQNTPVHLWKWTGRSGHNQCDPCCTYICLSFVWFSAKSLVYAKNKEGLSLFFCCFLKLMVILNCFPTCLIWLSGGDMLALIWPFLVLCKKKDKGYSHICLGSLFLPLPSPPPPLLPTPARTHTHTR